VNDEPAADDVAARVKAALDSADVRAIGDLLHPDVRWGAPDDPHPSCRNRTEVLAWYRRGWEAGVRARVSEIVAHEDKLLVGLRVARTPGAADVERWQVLTVAAGRIVDIRPFDDRAEAAAHAGLPR
jgi:ketosteroid isomerase-like protein